MVLVICVLETVLGKVFNLPILQPSKLKLIPEVLGQFGSGGSDEPLRVSAAGDSAYLDIEIRCSDLCTIDHYLSEYIRPFYRDDPPR